VTAANQHGQAVDRLRNCYAAWMNTPDAGRIRVRWYRVADTGSFELNDYSSSNYDTSPHSDDPVIGEESTTRNPFLDWRDCCAPPWPHPSLTNCGNATAPTFLRYLVPALLWWSDLFGPVSVPAQPLTQVTPCRWRISGVVVSGVSFTYTFDLLPGGGASLTVLALVPLHPGRVAHYISMGAVDPSQPVPLPLDQSNPSSLMGSGTVTVRGQDPPYLLVRPCVNLAVGVSLYLRLGA